MSTDTSFADLVKRLNSMNNMTPDQERASLMESVGQAPKVLDDKEVSLADIAKLAGIKEYVEPVKHSKKAEALVESITKEPKSESSIAKAIKESDLVISTGGVSVGDADYIKDVVKSLGNINFWKVAVKPGRPLAFGKLDNTIFFGLPGNPVSVMVTFLLFVLPTINMMAGKKYQLKTENAILKSSLRKRQGRAELQRGIFYLEKNKMYVKSVGEQGSGILSSMAKANCLIYLPVEKGKSKINDTVEIIKFKDYI